MLITKADVQSALGRVLADLPNPYIDERFNPGINVHDWTMQTCLTGAVLAALPIGFDRDDPHAGFPNQCLHYLPGVTAEPDALAYLHALLTHNDARRNWHDAPKT